MPKLVMRPESMQFARLKEKGTVKKVSKAINTDWFSSNISPTNPPANHRIYMMVASDTVVKLEIDDGTNTDEEYKLNSGTALKAGNLYAFDLIVLEGYSYNIQHETTTQNVICWVVESSVLS